MDELSTPPVLGPDLPEDVRPRTAATAASPVAKRVWRIEHERGADEDDGLATDEDDDGKEHNVDVSPE